MFIMSLKLNKTKIATFVMICALIVALLLLIAPDNGFLSGGKEAIVKNNEDRLTFIRSFGWETATEPIEIEEVLIPTVFDEVYEQYNLLQKENGYDLTAYMGKRVKRYTYQITNYPDKPEENVRVNLLVYNNRVIGGDVSSTSLSGFMHGFENPISAVARSASASVSMSVSSRAHSGPGHASHASSASSC